MLAILGCNTTSRVYGPGKALSLKRITSSSFFRDKARQFSKQDATIYEVVDAGDAALVCLYNGKDGDNLDDLRYKVLQQGCNKQSTYPAPSIAPDFCGGKVSQHARIPAGTTLGGHLLSERDRVEWMEKDGNLLPVMTDLPPAPEDLICIIRCDCTTDCSTARCSCRKHNLECSPAYGQCRGVGCCNSSVADSSEDDDYEI